MIFAFIFTLFIGLCAVALIGLEDSHYRVTRLLEELDQQAAQRPSMFEQAMPVVPLSAVQQTADSFDEMSFSQSLLALNRVDSLVPGDSPILAPAESSSSESAHPVQSKDHVQVL
jgi:hypothetical protein